MRITDVGIRVVQPFGIDEHFPGSVIRWLFVEIDTDEGITGIGECSGWYSRHGVEMLARSLDAIRSDLIGIDPFEIEQIWQSLFREFTYIGSRGFTLALISGIDIALWDIKGKALDRPVYDLLGGAVRGSLPLGSHPRGSTPEEISAHCQELVSVGFDTLKLDPFPGVRDRVTSYLDGRINRRDIAAGVDVMMAVRHAIGADVELVIDLHGGYNAATALSAIEAVEGFGVSWFEEPFQAESIDALRQLRGRTNVNLAVGERAYTRWEFLPLLTEGLVNFIIPNICSTGGISEMKRIATLAETFFVPVVPLDAFGPVQLMASAQVMIGTPNFHCMELDPSMLPNYAGCFAEPPDIRGGELYLSSRPGLGLSFDRDWIEAHTVMLVEN